MIRDYYCLNLKFKDQRISDKMHHAHLYISDEDMYFHVIDNDTQSNIDLKFAHSENTLGLFEENFEILETEVSIFFDKSRIYRFASFQNDEKNRYFKIHVTNIGIVKENTYKEFVNEGKVYLNSNGLYIVNLFYSFFSNYENKDQFTISRMNGMSDFYDAGKLLFRPELEYTTNEKRGSGDLTIVKKPTMSFKFRDMEFEDIKNNLQIICNFFSFYYRVRLVMEKIVFRTETEMFFYRGQEPNNKTFVSDLSSVSQFLKSNFRIESTLKTDWFKYYIEKEKHLTKAIDNLLHAREVNYGASFILLFNIIEIFTVSKKEEKFKFNSKKGEISEKLFETLKVYLIEGQDEDQFKDKLIGVMNRLEFKPFKSPLEKTLRENNIDPNSFKFSFQQLKKTRDSITHGSINSIKEDVLQSQVYCLQEISIRLILSNLGFKKDLR